MIKYLNPSYIFNLTGKILNLVKFFIIPILILLNFVLSGFSVIDFQQIFKTAFTSISLAFVSSSYHSQYDSRRDRRKRAFYFFDSYY